MVIRGGNNWKKPDPNVPKSPLRPLAPPPPPTPPTGYPIGGWLCWYPLAAPPVRASGLAILPPLGLIFKGKDVLIG